MHRALTHFGSIFHWIIMIIIDVSTWYDLLGLYSQKGKKKIYRYFWDVFLMLWTLWDSRRDTYFVCFLQHLLTLGTCILHGTFASSLGLTIKSSFLYRLRYTLQVGSVTIIIKMGGSTIISKLFLKGTLFVIGQCRFV